MPITLFLNCLKTFALSVIENLVYYKTLTYVLPLTIKQKAHLCSIKSSAIMFSVGVYYNYLYFFDFENFTVTSKFGTDIVMVFVGYLATDIYLGQNEYPRYFGVLTGDIHHRFYIYVSLASIYYQVSNVLLLFMVSELPSFLLSVGSYDEQFRDDLTFGYTFLATRIFYHSAMVYHFWSIPMVPYVGSLSFLVHGYWFSNWVTKYLF